MRRSLGLALFLVLGISILSASPAAGPRITVLSDRPGATVIEFTLGDYAVGRTDADGVECVRIYQAGQVTHLDRGYPELPTFCRDVIVDDRGQVDWRVTGIEYETKNVGTILPSKGNLPRSVDPEQVPYEFAGIYGRDEFWPVRTVEVSEPFIMRDFRGVTVRINPFRYNAVRNELKIVRRVRIEITKAAGTGINELAGPRKGLLREFVNIYGEQFVNFSPERYDSISERPGRMFIITANAYNANMQPFVDWKKRKGIYTKIVNVSTIGNTTSAIKARIQAEYDSTDLAWVLLVGEGNEVVPAVGNRGSATGADADPVYAYVAGSDFYPDIFISRMSSRGGAAANIDKQVSRSIGYERTPQLAASWYHVGLGVASNQDGGTGYADSTRMNWLRDSLLVPKYFYTAVNKSYDSWGSSTIIKNFIEAGTGIINYIGHGTETGWVNGGGFYNSNINSLNNPWMLPFVISVACVVGNFDGIDCYCEVSVTAGEVNQPDGFLVHWGSTINQSWVPPCIGQQAAVNLLTHDFKNTFGGICYNGACRMIEYYGSTNNQGIEMAQTWHIFGDASIQVRTNTVDTMVVTHDSFIGVTDIPFEVNVKAGDGVTPVANALVCCYIADQVPELHVTGWTDTAGNVILDVSPLNPIDTVAVTVTHYNHRPYEGWAVFNLYGLEENLASAFTTSLSITPNPFLEKATVRVGIADPAAGAALKIFDSAGRLVRSYNTGAWSEAVITWHGDDAAGRRLPRGVYFVRLLNGDEELTEKIVFIR